MISITVRNDSLDGVTVFDGGDITIDSYLRAHGYVVGRSVAMKKFRPIHKIEKRYHVVARVSLVQAIASVEVDHYRREFDIGDLYFVTTKKGNTKNIISKRLIFDRGNRFYDSSKDYFLGGDREVLG